MPSESTSDAPGKRKSRLSQESSPANKSLKKIKPTNHSDFTANATHPKIQDAEENGSALRTFYGPEMSNARALAYKNGELSRPVENLDVALSETKSKHGKIEVGSAVVHWFKCDLRTRDNSALSLASKKAKENGVPLLTMYIVSPQDFEAHLISPARVDLILRTLQVLKDDLAKLDIPLHIEVVKKRNKITGRILELLTEWEANHIFTNAEYEVDELRREARLVRECSEKGIAMDVLHDTCIVKPGELSSRSGTQYSVYSPWYRAWVAHIHKTPILLDPLEEPCRNASAARERYHKLFESTIPDKVENKELSDEEKVIFRTMWPAGEHEALERIVQFSESRIQNYHASRDFPSAQTTSSLSAYLASGAISARTAVRTARDHNSTKKLDAGLDGIKSWISEIAWRDFYKHVLCHSPYICMNKPFKIEYSNMEWEYNHDHFTAWCEGKTGYPIVDAGMRQLNKWGWMHNRCRMIVASFLAKDLLIDWRMGEKYFMEHLIDGDFASNNGGWGFSASTGVDPQPYFRIFNPILQSEKFDPKGEYIREWVPELNGIEGKAIHDPYNRGKATEAQESGYPRQIVDHRSSRDKCLARYKDVLRNIT